MDYKIDMATEKDTEEILDIYHSLIGKDGCTWDFHYPNIDDVKSDIRKKSLYLVFSHQEIIAVAAAGKDDELKEIDGYSKEIKAPCALSRIAVKMEYQNKGIAKYLIQSIEKQAVERGFDGVHLLVSKMNPHAIAVYDKMNYMPWGMQPV